MTRSYGTASLRKQASRRITRDRHGRPILPRIVVHPPRPGDVHPLERSALLKLLPFVPLRFLSGLEGIELRARESPEVGLPFGTYQPAFRWIRLYSMPFPHWPYWADTLRPRSMLGLCGATLIDLEGQRFLHWPDRISMARYYFAWILAHELGHHHVYEYRNKRRAPGSSRGHEARADALAFELRGLRRFDYVFGIQA